MLFTHVYNGLICHVIFGIMHLKIHHGEISLQSLLWTGRRKKLSNNIMVKVYVALLSSHPLHPPLLHFYTLMLL